MKYSYEYKKKCVELYRECTNIFIGLKAIFLCKGIDKEQKVC